MFLKEIAVFSFIFFTYSCLDACQYVYNCNSEIIHISNEEVYQLENDHDCCHEGWLNWQCCRCHYYNGKAFKACQNCQNPKCGI